MKLTQWHKGSVKPVHVGVYERDYSDITFEYKLFGYALWDGNQWCHGFSTISDAVNQYAGKIATKHQSLPWRGLTK